MLRSNFGSFWRKGLLFELGLLRVVYSQAGKLFGTLLLGSCILSCWSLSSYLAEIEGEGELALATAGPKSTRTSSRTRS